MKILHIVPSYKPAYLYGGPIKSVHDFNSALVKLGVEVTVVTTAVNGKENLNVPLGKEVDLDGVKVIYFKAGFLRSWFYSSEMSVWLKEDMGKFDLVHITSVFLFASTIGAYYAKKFNKPYIISPRGSLMSEPVNKKSFLKKKIYINLIEKRNLAGAEAIHFTAEKEKDEYVDIGLPLKKGIVIPNGLNYDELDIGSKPEEFREKLGIRENQKVILFLSRISWKKGFDTLIPAFAKVLKENKDAVLLIAGGDDEGYKKEVQKIAEKEGVSGKIIYSGMLRGGEKVSAFRAADVFVLPSYSENFGNVILEAMHLGLPTIITNKIALADDILKNEAGIVIKKDVGELAESILKVLSDKEYSTKIGEAGRIFSQKFNSDLIAKDWVKEYNSIIKTK